MFENYINIPSIPPKTLGNYETLRSYQNVNIYRSGSNIDSFKLIHGNCNTFINTENTIL